MRFASAVLVFGMVGCQQGPSLEIYDVEPNSGWTSAATPVRIYANHVFPAVNIPAGDADGVETNTGLVAEMRPIASDVSWVEIKQIDIDSDGNVVGVVQEGLQTGHYDVRLQDVRGREAVLENAFEVTYSEISRFEVFAQESETVSGKPIEVSAAAILAGSVDNAVHSGGVAVRVWMEPMGADVSAFSQLELTINPPISATWEDKRESASKPVFEGILTGSQRFELLANTEVTAKFEIEEILDDEVGIEPANGGMAVTWGVREDLLLSMNLNPLTGESVSPDEGPVEVEAGDLVEVNYALAYADQSSTPTQGQNIEFFVQDQNGFLPAFHINPSRDTSPVLLPMLNEATQPPATDTAGHIQLVAWELGRNFDLQTLSCPPPEGALYTCAAPIEVSSGEASDWRLEAGVAETKAGKLVSFAATPVDMYGNRTTWFGDVSQWSLVQTLMSGDVPLLSVLCEQPSSLSTIVFCEGRPTAAKTAPVRMVDDATGWSAVSADLMVFAGDVERLELDLTLVAGNNTVKAGQAFDVALTMYDAYENVVSDDALTTLADSLQWFGVNETPQCTLTTTSSTGVDALDFLCFFEVALDAQTMTVRLGDLETESTAFSVVPGDLEVIDVQVVTDTSNLVAGSEIEVDFVVTDAFGNTLDTVVGGFEAFTVPASQTLTNLEVDENGECSAGFQLFTAGPNVVIATFDGDEVGRSLPFDVLAGAAETLKVEAERPWGWVNEPLKIRVSTRDAYNNIALSSDNVTISYAAESAQVNTSLVDGVADLGIVWDDWYASDVVNAESVNGFTASVSGLVIQERCTTGAPTLGVTWGGIETDNVRRMCHDSNGDFDITANFSTTTPASGESISSYHLWVEPLGYQQLLSPGSARVSGQGRGVFEAWGFISQSNGCGVEVNEQVWVGSGDDIPLGPLHIVSDDFAIDMSSSSAHLTDVDVGPVYNCSSDFVDSAKIFVRTDGGELSGAALNTDPDGGLYVEIDPVDGMAEFVLDASTLKSEGDVTIHGWSADQDTRGAAVVEIVEADQISPMVWVQDEQGSTSSVVTTLSVYFSETLDEDRVEDKTNYELCDATNQELVSLESVTFDEPSNRAVLTLAESVDLGEDEWWFTIFGGVSGPGSFSWLSPCGQSLSNTGSSAIQGVADLAGNRLRNVLPSSTVPNDYMLTFGDVPDASQNASCVGMSPLSTFRPDGDESSVVGQKDVVEVSVQTDTVTAPFSWRASVYREDGVLVRRDFFSGVSALFSFTWDGRDQNERILSPGKYVIKVHPMDASGNAGADCEHDVQLNNVVGD